MPPSARNPAQPQFLSVRASLLTALVDLFATSDRGIHRLLERSGLAGAQDVDPYATVPMAQFVGFLEEGAAVSGDGAFGARLGSSVRAADMGPVGIVLSLSENVAGGMARFARFTRALQSGTDAQWIRSEDRWIFSYRVSDPTLWPRRHDAEFSLSSVVQVIRDNFRARWSPEEVHFEHSAPPDTQPLEKIFRCPVRFDQPINRLIFAADICEEPVRKEDADLLAALQRHVQDIIGTAVETPDIIAAVRSVIEANLGLRAITLDYVATALSMTPRTLQRRLSREGVTLRALLEEIRHRRAMSLLSQSRAKVSDVSDALGYSDPTAFWRAWRGWTGTTPSHAKSIRAR